MLRRLSLYKVPQSCCMFVQLVKWVKALGFHLLLLFLHLVLHYNLFIRMYGVILKHHQLMGLGIMLLLLMILVDIVGCFPFLSNPKYMMFFLPLNHLLKLCLRGE